MIDRYRFILQTVKKQS